MKQNIGKTDKNIRLFFGILIAALGVYFKSWWGLLAILPLLTALITVCPLYKLIGIKTNKNELKADV
jgi:predicted RND superfamily exporter protein